MKALTLKQVKSPLELVERPDTAAAERALVQALTDPTIATRWNAAVALAWLGRDDGLSLIHAGVRSPQRWRRWEAIHALGRVHDGDSVGALAPVLGSGDARERGEVWGEAMMVVLTGAISLWSGRTETAAEAPEWASRQSRHWG